MSIPFEPRRKDQTLVTHDRLMEFLTYDAETGHFWCRKPNRSTRRGKPLGYVESNGYRRVCLDGQRYLAGRLAWFYVTATWPPETIDHINCDRDDNRFCNLRLATRYENQRNRKKPDGYASPLKGAHWNRFRGSWQSYIRIDGKSRFLGRFDTPEQAHAAYAEAARSHNAQFARVS